MAIILKNLYEQTKNQYNLNLICGSFNSYQTMNWVYLTEDIDNFNYLSEGQLVITTGIQNLQCKDWLLKLLKNLVKAETCGLIINTGKYIFDNDITYDVKKFCEDNNYPLISMPWEISLSDITYDYYNRIFNEIKNRQTISSAFKSLIFNQEDKEKAVDFLKSSGCNVNQTYTILCITGFEHYSDSNTEKILSSIHKSIHKTYNEYYICTSNNYIFIIVSYNSMNIIELLDKLVLNLRKKYDMPLLFSGAGNEVTSLNLISESAFHALSAAAMAKSKNLSSYNFNDMGFFKILLSIKDTKQLNSYADEHLGKILEYDSLHNTILYETLYNYLTLQKSVLKVSKVLYCHRNTINYRLRIIREELGYELDDSMACFELLASFLIKDYLKLDIRGIIE